MCYKKFLLSWYGIAKGDDVLLQEYPTDDVSGLTETVEGFAEDWTVEADDSIAVCSGVAEIQVSGSESPFV